MNIKKITLLSLLVLTAASPAYAITEQQRTLSHLAMIALATYTALTYSITRPNNKHKLIGLLATYAIGMGTAAAYVIKRQS